MGPSVWGLGFRESGELVVGGRGIDMFVPVLRIGLLAMRGSCFGVCEPKVNVGFSKGFAILLLSCLVCRIRCGVFIE